MKKEMETSAAAPSVLDVFEFPCSLSQQRFWVLDQLSPGDPCYNIAVRWRLAGRVDPSLVERAFNEMLKRHDVLRTVFDERNGSPVQIILPDVHLSIPVVDLRRFPPAEREKKAEKVTLTEAQRPFDLKVAPLIRVTLLRIEDEEFTVLVTVHHIVADGWSIGIMAHEMGEFYQAFVSQRVPALADLPIQYADFSVWQQEWLNSDELQSQSGYWKKKLEGLNQFEIVSDFPRPAVQTTHGMIHSRLLPRELTNAVKSFSNQRNVTLYTTALSIFKMLLWHWSGQSDIALGTQVVGRNNVEIENLVGVFINTLVLRTKLNPDCKFSDLLRSVEETVDGALNNQDAPFEKLVEFLRPKRDLSRNPLFSVNFIYQRAFIKNREFAGISLVDLPSRSPGAMYDLNFFMVERVDGWRWSCEFNTDLYKPATVDDLLDSFQALLQAVVENPERSLAEFSSYILRKDSRQGTVHLANETQPDKAFPMGHVRSREVRRNQARGKLVRNDLESELTKIWEEFLNVRPISLKDDFFDLGGHSLLAIRMLARVEKEFGKKVSLATLFQSSTIKKLASSILGEMTRPGLTALQPQGDKTPFFWINGWPSVRNLALEIGLDRPLLSVNLPDDLVLSPPYTVQDLAQRYIAIIRDAYPHGPYVLGGWCRAGLVAFEVAQQLRAAGEEVQLVAFFDTWNPGYMSRYSSWEARRARLHLGLGRVRFHLGQLVRRSPRKAIEYTRYHLRNLGDRWKAAMLGIAYRVRSRGIAVPVKQHSETDMVFLATSEYQVRPYNGRVVLFRFDEYKDWKYWDSNLGWDADLTGSFEVHELPGRHNSGYFFIAPYLPSVAQRLNIALDSASREKTQLVSS